MNREEKKQAWLAFASAAVSGLGGDAEYEDLDDMVADAAEVADKMLVEYADRFGGRDDDDGPKLVRRRKR